MNPLQIRISAMMNRIRNYFGRRGGKEEAVRSIFSPQYSKGILILIQGAAAILGAQTRKHSRQQNKRDILGDCPNAKTVSPD